MSSQSAFEPRVTLLPAAQRQVLRELAGVPRRFVLYGETAVTLRLGHRASLDFNLFSNDHFQPDTLERALRWLRGAVRVRSEPDTLVAVVHGAARRGEGIGAAIAVCGSTFNPLLSLKALAYFGDGDLPSLPKATREALERAVRDTSLETIRPISPRGGIAP